MVARPCLKAYGMRPNVQRCSSLTTEHLAQDIAADRWQLADRPMALTAGLRHSGLVASSNQEIGRAHV